MVYGLYESAGFAAMPISGRGAHDARCDREGILIHSRASGVHVRGWWVVDLVLVKQ
jgi:hypothetical protein